jgi:hypothetical protein
MSHNHSIAPEIELTLEDELQAQYYQMIEGLQIGLYLKQTGKEVEIIDENTGEKTGERDLVSCLTYPNMSPRTSPYQTGQIDILDHYQQRMGLEDVRAVHSFSPLTLLLCGSNQVFKTAFINAYTREANADRQAAEREAFVAAFSAPNTPVFSENDDFIQEIRNYANKKSAQVKHNGEAINSPKKAFLNALANALTGTNTDVNPQGRRQAAEALFESGNHERIRKNTGFWAVIRKIFFIDFFSKEKHQTKTFSFAGAFFNAPRSVNTENPLNPALTGQGTPAATA